MPSTTFSLPFSGVILFYHHWWSFFKPNLLVGARDDVRRLLFGILTQDLAVALFGLAARLLLVLSCG